MSETQENNTNEPLKVYMIDGMHAAAQFIIAHNIKEAEVIVKENNLGFTWLFRPPSIHEMGLAQAGFFL